MHAGSWWARAIPPSIVIFVIASVRTRHRAWLPMLLMAADRQPMPDIVLRPGGTGGRRRALRTECPARGGKCRTPADPGTRMLSLDAMDAVMPYARAEDPVLEVTPLGFPWETADPFLFCVHHDDAYPRATSSWARRVARRPRPRPGLRGQGRLAHVPRRHRARVSRSTRTAASRP